VVRAHHGPAPAARLFLELLHACLVHRFGTDVLVGDGRRTARVDDIALGGVV
jgi:hypothetical protein